MTSALRRYPEVQHRHVRGQLIIEELRDGELDMAVGRRDSVSSVEKRNALRGASAAPRSRSVFSPAELHRIARQVRTSRGTASHDRGNRSQPPESSVRPFERAKRKEQRHRRCSFHDHNELGGRSRITMSPPLDAGRRDTACANVSSIDEQLASVRDRRQQFFDARARCRPGCRSSRRRRPWCSHARRSARRPDRRDRPASSSTFENFRNRCLN